MVPTKEQLSKYAHLTIQMGVNVQKGQALLINAPIEARQFVHHLVDEAYEAGSEDVQVNWIDEVLTKKRYDHEPLSVLEHVPNWVVERQMTHAKNGGAVLNIHAPNPDLLEDVDAERVAKASKARSEALKDFKKYIINDKIQWSIVSVPTEAWAKKIYDTDDADKAVEDLWKRIFQIVRVDQDDPIQAWKDHNETLFHIRDYLNDKQYDALEYSSEYVDLTVKLPENHVWAGGGAVAETGASFNPNMPTEEVFTAPDFRGVNGTVQNTKPLNYNGNLIDDFKLTFKDGEVVEYEASKGKETLKHLLDSDEGAKYLGEIALVPHSSPISQSELVFFNTLYDENASCHLALGSAYPTNVEGGEKLEDEELKEKGINTSLIHEDFMVGSADLNVYGVTKDGDKEPIIKDGEWAIKGA
ncbi:aminopeptidase [Alkalibacillus haloalkaliphilus]|uniref:Aminopeptidase n=1 Tax=Alkalibacillus haloalkaliphilus TaxID=94136 RepID=A0A511VZV4_9BACI|nr:aminopeptidase [Alkalibacillus haloalkaliphilus]GEN44325.1 aminopeptidase [Alkalibacillus haloalkaliphilus]